MEERLFDDAVELLRKPPSPETARRLAEFFPDSSAGRESLRTDWDGTNIFCAMIERGHFDAAILVVKAHRNSDLSDLTSRRDPYETAMYVAMVAYQDGGPRAQELVRLLSSGALEPHVYPDGRTLLLYFMQTNGFSAAAVDYVRSSPYSADACDSVNGAEVSATIWVMRACSSSSVFDLLSARRDCPVWQGCEVARCNPRKETCLHAAAAEEREGAIRALARLGQSHPRFVRSLVAARNDAGFTALHFSAVNSSVPVLEALLDLGFPDIDVVDPALFSFAVDQGPGATNEDFLVALSNKIVKLEHVPRTTRWTPLAYAVLRGYVKLARFIVSVDPGSFDRCVLVEFGGEGTHLTPLQLASALKCPEMIEAITTPENRSRNGDLDDSRNHPLRYATGRKNFEVLRALMVHRKWDMDSIDGVLTVISTWGPLQGAAESLARTAVTLSDFCDCIQSYGLPSGFARKVLTSAPDGVPSVFVRAGLLLPPVDSAGGDGMLVRFEDGKGPARASELPGFPEAYTAAGLMWDNAQLLDQLVREGLVYEGWHYMLVESDRPLVRASELLARLLVERPVPAKSFTVDDVVCLAAAHNRPDVIELLGKGGVPGLREAIRDAALRDRRKSALCCAVESHAMDAFRYLLPFGTRRHEGFTSELSAAIASGHEDMATEIAAAENFEDYVCGPEGPLLHSAAAAGMADLVRACCEARRRNRLMGRDTSIAAEYKSATPLVLALREGHPKVARVLLAEGDVYTLGGQDEVVTRCAALQGGDPECIALTDDLRELAAMAPSTVRQMMSYAVDQDARKNTDDAVRAVYRSDPASVYLRATTAPPGLSNYSVSPLEQALRSGAARAAVFLIKRGALRDGPGSLAANGDPLVFLAFGAYYTVCRAWVSVLDAFQDWYERNPPTFGRPLTADGRTLWHAAAECHSAAALLALFYRYGSLAPLSDVTTADERGETPLAVAVRLSGIGRYEVGELLGEEQQAAVFASAVLVVLVHRYHRRDTPEQGPISTEWLAGLDADTPGAMAIGSHFLQNEPQADELRDALRRHILPAREDAEEEEADPGPRGAGSPRGVVDKAVLDRLRAACAAQDASALSAVVLSLADRAQGPDLQLIVRNTAIMWPLGPGVPETRSAGLLAALDAAIASRKWSLCRCLTENFRLVELDETLRGRLAAELFGTWARIPELWIAKPRESPFFEAAGLAGTLRSHLAPHLPAPQRRLVEDAESAAVGSVLVKFNLLAHRAVCLSNQKTPRFFGSLPFFFAGCISRTERGSLTCVDIVCSCLVAGFTATELALFIARTFRGDYDRTVVRDRLQRVAADYEYAETQGLELTSADVLGREVAEYVASMQAD